jgi:hypothetical protein
MGKWKLKDPNSRVVSNKGNVEINSSTITDELVNALVEANPNYASLFVEVTEEAKPKAKSDKD